MFVPGFDSKLASGFGSMGLASLGGFPSAAGIPRWRFGEFLLEDPHIAFPQANMVVLLVR